MVVGGMEIRVKATLHCLKKVNMEELIKQKIILDLHSIKNAEKLKLKRKLTKLFIVF